MNPSEPKLIQDFVAAHWPYFLGMAFTIFGMGTGLGRFIFDGAMGTLRAERDFAKTEKDRAVALKQDAETQLKALTERSLAIQTTKDAHLRRAFGRFLLTASVVVILGMLGFIAFNLYSTSRQPAVQPKAVVQTVYKDRPCPKLPRCNCGTNKVGVKVQDPVPSQAITKPNEKEKKSGKVGSEASPNLGPSSPSTTIPEPQTDSSAPNFKR